MGKDEETEIAVEYSVLVFYSYPAFVATSAE
jgi:hypothetical protein